MLEKNQIVSLTTAEMQLHFEVKKYFEEEKKLPKNSMEVETWTKTQREAKIFRIVLPWKNVNSL